MQPVRSLSHRIDQGVLWPFLVIGCAFSASPAVSADLCDLKFQSTARGEWAIQRKPNEHFVFRTQRKLLEPPAIHGNATFYDIAEDAAMDALQLFTIQNHSESEKKGTLTVSRNQAQRLRCGDKHWTVFIFDLAKVRWEKTEEQPPTSSPQPLAPVPMTSGLAPKASQPNKPPTRTLTTIEE